MTNTLQPLRREPVRLWFWTITSATYPFKRRKTTWRMTEGDARARHGDDAVKVEGSLWIRAIWIHRRPTPSVWDYPRGPLGWHIYAVRIDHDGVMREVRKMRHRDMDPDPVLPGLGGWRR